MLALAGIRPPIASWDWQTLKCVDAKPFGLVLALALAAGIAGCGVRGPLDPPPSASAEGVAKSAEAGASGENSAAPPKPHEDFILDPLLR
ncbi:MAG: lipoprotein [Hyphomicrobiaceae bacterium]|nr:lipoprotein [Hyphomicrobiaceae bacterium]